MYLLNPSSPLQEPTAYFTHKKWTVGISKIQNSMSHQQPLKQGSQTPARFADGGVPTLAYTPRL